MRILGHIYDLESDSGCLHAVLNTQVPEASVFDGSDSTDGIYNSNSADRAHSVNLGGNVGWPSCFSDYTVIVISC